MGHLNSPNQPEWDTLSHFLRAHRAGFPRKNKARPRTTRGDTRYGGGDSCRRPPPS